jgi:tetratricopeptide (TPR) repeat protein
LADCYSKIAVVYYVIGDYNTAEEYYDKTFEMYQRLGMKKAEGRIYNNYGLLYQSLGRSTEAAVYFEKSIEMCTDYNNTRGVAIAIETIGMFWFEDLENNAMALNKFNKSLAVWRNTNAIYGQAQTLVHLMYVHNDNKDFNKSIIAGNESLTYTLESGAKDVERDLYKELYIAYEGLKQNNKTFYYYKKHIALKDSLSSFNEFEKIKMVTLKYELEKENLQDSLNIIVEYEKKAIATASDIKLQRFWTGLLSLGFIGLIVIIFLLSKSKNNVKKVPI